MMKPETLLKRKIVRALRLIPHSSWHVINQAVIRGDPDIIGCCRERFYAIEVKNEFTKKFDDRERLQRHKLARIGRAGGVILIITARTWRFHVKRIKEQAAKTSPLAAFATVGK